MYDSYSSAGSFSWVKFFILWIPFSVAMLIWAPSLKWKIAFIIAGALGVYIALIGKSMKGLTPLGRKF